MRALALALVALISLVGCQTEFQKKLKERKAFAEKEAGLELERLVRTHRERAARDLPEDMSVRVDGRSAAVVWRAKTAASDTLEQIEGLLRRLGAANPEVEKGAKEAMALFGGQREYWVEKKKLQNYEKFLAELGTFHKQGILAEEVAFERIYLHVANLYEREKYDEDTQLTSMMRYWKLAFDFPGERREAFMDYIARLCAAKLPEYCRSIPWEDRPHALEKPYLETLAARIVAFRERFPQSVYLPVLALLERQMRGRAGAVGPFIEEPVLAAMASGRDCVGRTILELSPRGLIFDGDELLPADPGYAWDAKARKAAQGRFGEILWERIEQMGGNDPYISLITVLPASDAPAEMVLDLLRIMAANRVDQVALCGRKRNDDSNKKTMHLLTLFPRMAKRKKEVLLDAQGNVDKITQVDPMDAERFAKSLPARAFGTKLEWLGFLGRLPVQIPSPSKALRPKGEGWQEAAVDEKGRVGATTELARPDPRTITSAAVVVVPGKVSLPDLLKALDGVATICKDPACKAVEASERPVAIGIAH